MHFWHSPIGLQTRKSYFLRCWLKTFWCKSMFSPKSQLRSIGGLLGIIVDFILVLLLFLKGHVEATLTIRSYECESSFFATFLNVDFCDTSSVLARFWFWQIANTPIGAIEFWILARFLCVFWTRHEILDTLWVPLLWAKLPWGGALIPRD